jgi:macrodomain Ter protein organizer (MatP/YcbG family)
MYCTTKKGVKMPRREKPNDKRVSTFMPYEVFEKLKADAQKKGLTVSGLIRMLILEYVNKEKEG